MLRALEAAAPGGSADSVQVFGSCSAAPAVVPASPEALAQHLRLGAEGQPVVAVVCAEGPAEEEAALLAAAHSALSALTPDYLMVWTTGAAAGAKVRAAPHCAGPCWAALCCRRDVQPWHGGCRGGRCHKGPLGG